MNHCVPQFEPDDDHSIPSSSAVIRSRKSSIPEDEIMELLWQNGQVVVQSQNQRSLKKAHTGEPTIPAAGEFSGKDFRSEEATNHLFMQEDEMASWLHYPLDFDRDIYSDIIYPVAPTTTTATSTLPEIRFPEIRPPIQSEIPVAPRPPVPPTKRLEGEKRFQNWKAIGRLDCGPSNPMKTTRESPAVSVDKPSPVSESRIFRTADISGANLGQRTLTAGRSMPISMAPCELTTTSSPGGSGASASAASAEPPHKLPSPVDNRKRKVRDADDSDCHSEGVEFESTDTKKQIRGSTSTKRSRAAEVHNLSERRRRDRINEKMKALQDLIPGCNKSDKASMLDEAIEYLKSLQVQVQMMSMGCSMVPVMIPGVQQYMPPMAMGMGMGMGMGMNMDMTRPLMPFPIQNPASSPNMPPRFAIPNFHVQQRMNQTDPYQHSTALHHIPQNQATGQHNNTSNNGEMRNTVNNQSDKMQPI